MPLGFYFGTQFPSMLQDFVLTVTLSVTHYPIQPKLSSLGVTEHSLSVHPKTKPEDKYSKGAWS